MERARTVLEKALALSPNLARANFFYARVLRTDGNYEGAAARLRIVLAEYPRDRVALNDLGRILFLQRKYAEAVNVLQSVFAIDPEDLQAHYNLMLCYSGLGNEKLAKEHQARYMRFKADESSQAITGPYRQSHPEDNNERQSIHEHVSVPLPALASKPVSYTHLDVYKRQPVPSVTSGRQQRTSVDSRTRFSAAARARIETHRESRLGCRVGQIPPRAHCFCGSLQMTLMPSRFLCVSVSLWWILLLVITAQGQQIRFRDITAQAGIQFTHNNGSFGKKWLPETMGPGCAFIDYDNDGYPDILLVNGEDWPGHTHAGLTTPKLYHNNHDGTFTDVTRKAGLAVPMFGLGVAVGDYDNDGFDDIFITCLLYTSRCV